MTVLENVLLGFQGQRGEKLVEAIFGRPGSEREELRGRATEILGKLGLAEKSRERARDLSYGEQKLLAIARAIVTKADLLLLDEPAAGLARGAVERILALIKELVKGGRTVLLIDHHMEAVMEVSDWVVVLDAGRKIAEGRPEEIQRDEEVIKVYLGL
jgi:branched-chain amino acid transport system permease protein